MNRLRGKFRVLATVLGLAIFTLMPAILHAQEVATLTGTITDTTGAVVPGVNLTLVNTRTNATFQTVASSTGVYSFAKVPPGPGYALTAKRDGFETIVVKDIYLTVNTNRTEDIQMKVGHVNESVEVSAESAAVTLDTTDATVGTNFNMNAVSQLPIQIRDSPASLLTLQPGVVSATSGSDDLSSRTGAVTGARGDQNNITLDGLDVNDFSTGQAFSTVANAPVESIQEFRGETAGSLSASGRGSGGQVQMVTKSGTNQFHGSAFEYHRNTLFAANTWFNDNNGLPKPTLLRNQFGATLGGPLVKDKLFFFFNYNGRREAQAVTALTIVPLDSFRNGNLHYIKNVDSSGTPCSGTSTLLTKPNCIGTLDSAAIAALDPQHIGPDAALLSFINSRYPHANDLTQGDGVNTGGFRFNAPVHRTENDYVTRIDYNLNSNMKLFGRFSILHDEYGDSVNYQAPIKFPGDPITHSIRDSSYAYVIGHTWTISPTMVNQFTYGKTVSKLDFPTNFNPVGTNYWAFGGGASVAWSNPYYSQASQGRVDPIPIFRDDLTWQRGSHQIQFGGFFKPIKTHAVQNFDLNLPTLGLGGLTSDMAGVRPADIRTAGTLSTTIYDSGLATILGRIASVVSNYNYNSSLTPLPQGSGAQRDYRYWETEDYIQDTWKATPSLTLTYGLRYQYYSVPYEVNGIEAIPNLGIDELLATRYTQGQQGISGDGLVPITYYDLGGKANNARGLYEPNLTNFAPRFSFAYSPSSDGFLKRVVGDHKFVVRGGAGVLYDHPVTSALNFIQDQSTYMFQSTTTRQFGAATATDALLNDPRFTSIDTIPAPVPPPAISRPFAPYVDAGVPTGTVNNEFNYAIDPNLKTPYSIMFNFGIQRELPKHFVVEATYVGRLGRRLIAQADASQLVDFKDPTSGQFMSAGFNALTQALRGGNAYDASGAYVGPAVPWFENQIGPGGTAFVAENLGTLAKRGDVSDTVQALSTFYYYYGPGYGLQPNVGMPTQFAGNTYVTNKGSSNYHGLLMSLHRNFASGLQFDVNYTFAHSIDNTSQVANSIAAVNAGGFVCDALNLRLCRGNSDFDVKHTITGDFIYELPFGKGKAFGSGVANWENEIIGGWSISGIPTYRSGFAFSTTTSAFLLGYANLAPAIFNGDQHAIRVDVHKLPDGKVTLFADPDAALAAFSGPSGFQIGSRNNLRGPSFFNLDFGVAKRFPITERLNMQFRADAFNALNHPNFAIPGSGNLLAAGADITSGQFGQITSAAGANGSNTARVVQFSLRVDF